MSKYRDIVEALVLNRGSLQTATSNAKSSDSVSDQRHVARLKVTVEALELLLAQEEPGRISASSEDDWLSDSDEEGYR